MKYILDLTFQLEHKEKWLSIFSSFRGLARTRSVDFRSILVKNPENVDQEFIEREIEHASAFILSSPSISLGDSIYLRQVVEKVESGTPLLCMLDRNYYQYQNAFLEPHGIEGTMLGLFSYPGDQSAEHPRDLFVTLEETPSAFRDPRLFNDVEELRLDSTHAIRLHGKARSLLALPLGAAFSIDTRSDLPEEWPTTEYTCIAGHFGRGNDKKRIIALGTSLISDQVDDQLGCTHYGIEGADNKIFAENLIHLLTDDDKSFNPSATSTAHSLIEQIERNYYDMTKNVLLQWKFDWWSEVPEPVREACAKKKECESNPSFPVSAYMVLLDYQRIWRTHWERFQPILEQAGVEGGKNRALAYFSKLNDIRKMVAHPTKMHAGSVIIVDADLDMLRKESQRSIVLWDLTNRLAPVRNDS